jgi:AcrR family transcriptional regulator
MPARTNTPSTQTTLNARQRARRRGKNHAGKETAPDDIGIERLSTRVDGVVGSERVVEIQRARILAAMVEVCAERGAGNVAVAHIVQRAGVSRRTFYELYLDREECFLGAFDDAIARAPRYMLDAYDPRAKWVERVRSILTGLLCFLEAERGAGQLLIVGSLGAGHNALERRRRVIAQMIALVNEGCEETKAGTELPPLTAEGIVGGVLSVLHARLADAPLPSTTLGLRTKDREQGSLIELVGPLMSMIVLPYLGPAAARRELARPSPALVGPRQPTPADPLRDVQMRLTYRTVRVLTAVAALEGRGLHPSNREIGLASDIQDQGQISKLLTRLSKLGLIENTGAGLARGAPNAWMLTLKGREIEQALREGAAG